MKLKKEIVVINETFYRYNILGNKISEIIVKITNHGKIHVYDENRYRDLMINYYTDLTDDHIETIRKELPSCNKTMLSVINIFDKLTDIFIKKRDK